MMIVLQQSERQARNTDEEAVEAASQACCLWLHVYLAASFFPPSPTNGSKAMQHAARACDGEITTSKIATLDVSPQ